MSNGISPGCGGPGRRTRAVALETADAGFIDHLIEVLDGRPAGMATAIAASGFFLAPCLSEMYPKGYHDTEFTDGPFPVNE